MKEALERRRELEELRQRWWWLMGSGMLVIGVPLVGLSLWPENSFWAFFLAPVLLSFLIALLVFGVRQRKAWARSDSPEDAHSLDDEYARDSIQRGSSLAYAVTASLLIVMPLVHYYVVPLTVFVVCWVPLMAGTSVQAFYVHRRMS
jgi:predicted lysophospholipase L1 biosynthesis ABC-type transport system permease subunit